LEQFLIWLRNTNKNIPKHLFILILSLWNE
jgi:hypothetical protein